MPAPPRLAGKRPQGHQAHIPVNQGRRVEQCPQIGAGRFLNSSVSVPRSIALANPSARRMAVALSVQPVTDQRNVLGTPPMLAGLNTSTGRPSRARMPEVSPNRSGLVVVDKTGPG